MVIFGVVLWAVKEITNNAHGGSWTLKDAVKMGLWQAR
jgi:hypothetical protein